MKVQCNFQLVGCSLCEYILRVAVFSAGVDTEGVMVVGLPFMEAGPSIIEIIGVLYEFGTKDSICSVHLHICVWTKHLKNVQLYTQ